MARFKVEAVNRASGQSTSLSVQAETEREAALKVSSETYIIGAIEREGIDPEVAAKVAAKLAVSSTDSINACGEGSSDAKLLLA
jgi:hypothetical protein